MYNIAELHGDAFKQVLECGNDERGREKLDVYIHDRSQTLSVRGVAVSSGKKRLRVGKKRPSQLVGDLFGALLLRLVRKRMSPKRAQLQEQIRFGKRVDL